MMDLVISVVEYVCLAVFLLEMTIKMTAVGLFMHKTAYFRDGWNILDFIAVAPGAIALAIGTLYASSVARPFRILRPLKSLTSFPNLRIMVRYVTSKQCEDAPDPVVNFTNWYMFHGRRRNSSKQ